LPLTTCGADPRPESYRYGWSFGTPQVSERLGHASVGIALDTYSHVLPNLQEEAIRAFDTWLSAPV